MNKELTELRELIEAQEKDEADFQDRTGKRMAKITALTARIQAKATPEPKPVVVDGYQRDLPKARKTRSDKGTKRGYPEPAGPTDPLQKAVDPDEAIGRIIGQVKEG